MVFEFRGVIHRKFVDAGYSGKDIGNDILSGSLGRKRRMKKLRKSIAAVTMISVCIFTSCSGQRNTNVHKEIDMTEVTDIEADEGFPDHYEYESDKIKCNCEIIVPENFDKNNFFAVQSVQKEYGDEAEQKRIYMEGKEIASQQESPAQGDLRAGSYYTFTDNSGLNMGFLFSYYTSFYKYYPRDPQANEALGQNGVSFMSEEECLSAIKERLKEIGFSKEEFIYEIYPMNHLDLEKTEEEQIAQGYRMEEDKKESWGEEDDAYYISAYQEEQSLPVFHEQMAIARSLAFDSPANAPVQMIYSARGVEWLYVSPVYSLERSQEKVSFQNFDDIMETVKMKFESILNEATYEIRKIKLFEMVRNNEQQEYEAFPVWYFETIEHPADTDIPPTVSVTVINALTGEEVYIK